MKINKLKFLTIILISGAVNNLLNAQTVVQDSVKLDEIVITGSKVYRPAGNITQKIDVISLQQMQTSVTGQNNIAEVIGNRPGISVSALSRNDANWGAYAGIGPKYSTFMLGGLPLDAFTDPMSLDLMAIERIEVQRGPASVLYPNYLSQDFAGNQSPLAGTVNLITRQKVDKQSTMASTAYGSWNTLNGQLYHQNVNGNLHYFGGLNYESSDYTNYGTNGSWLNMQKDPEYIKLKMYGGSTWYYGDNNQHKLTAFINHTKHKGDAGRVYRGYNHQYTTVNVGQTTELTQNLLLNASLGVRIYDRNWQESQFTDVDVLQSNNGVYQRIVPLDVNIGFKHGNHLLTVGADYQGALYYTHNDPLLGYSLYDNKSRATQKGLYIQEVLYVNNLVLRGGLRVNRIGTKIDLLSGNNPGDAESNYSRVLYSFGTRYNVHQVLSVYANIGNSFLTPGLKSVGGTIPLNAKNQAGFNGHLPNPDLKPESGIGSDFGLNLNFPMGFKSGLRVFYNRISDAIVDIRVSENPSQSQSINAGKSVSKGFELEMEHHINDSFWWFANFTKMKTEIEDKIDPNQNGAEIPFAPDKITNMGFTFSRSGFTIRPAINYNWGYYDSTSKTDRKKFTPNEVLNIYASKQLNRQKQNPVEIFTNIYNVTNNRYEMPWQFRNTGTSVMVGLKITFN